MARPNIYNISATSISVVTGAGANQSIAYDVW